MKEQWLRFDIDTGEFEPYDAPLGDPHVIDSFGTIDGYAIALDRHVDRFRRSVLALHDHDVSDVLTLAVRDAIAGDGHGFPRLEFVAPSTVLLHRRPRPPIATQLSYWLDRDATQRVQPMHKGPDLAANQWSAERARKHGADDALWVDGDECVLEGATTSVMWWEDEVLCALSADAPVLPSVTRAVILDNAEGLGIPIRRRKPTLDQLNGCEMWAVNALHGVRPVTNVYGTDLKPASPERFDMLAAQLLR